MKRVIFILLICALLVHPRAWALEDVTILKEEVGSKSQQTSSEDLTDLIKKLEDANESIRQEAKKQLLDRIWQESVRPFWVVDKEEEPLLESLYGGREFDESDIVLSDIDGNGTREKIASFLWEVWRDWGYIAVVDEILSTIQVMEVLGGPNVVKITDLLGEGKQALIIESRYQLNLVGLSRRIEIYQWEQGKFTNVWSKGIDGTFFYTPFQNLDNIGKTLYGAKVQIVDIDQNGIREIVRIGEIYESGYEGKELLKSEQEAEREKVEIEMGINLDDATWKLPVKFESDANFDKVTSGYETFRRFKEIYFWSKDFNRYIQYKARITKDTTAMTHWEPVSIASGTVVGVLGSDFQEDFNPDFVDVVFLDGQIGGVDKGILEKIESEDEQDR